MIHYLIMDRLILYLPISILLLMKLKSKITKDNNIIIITNYIINQILENIPSLNTIIANKIRNKINVIQG